MSVNRPFTRDVQTRTLLHLFECIDNGSVSSGLEAFDLAAQLFTNPYNPALDVGPCDFNQTNSFRGSGVVALPFHGNPFVEGWQLSGILSANSGYPINITTGYDISGEASGDRPDLVSGSPRPATVGSPAQWWAFPTNLAMPLVGELGNLPRNSALGPGFLNFDFALLKDTPVAISKQFRVEFRAEFFDIINHTNFGAPNGGLFISCATTDPACTPAFPGANGGFERSSTFGQVLTTIGNASTGGSQRVIQFGVKLLF